MPTFPIALLLMSTVVVCFASSAPPTLDRETLWIVSPTESDAVAAVIGRPKRYPQPNQPGQKGCASATDPRCAFVGFMHTAETQSDLGQDIYKTLGSVPVLLPDPTSVTQPNSEFPKAGEVVVFLGTVAAAPWILQLFPSVADCLDDWEKHCVRSFPFGPDRRGTAIVATGAGDRGAIYAAYEVSHSLLGVSPWWWWTGREPQWKGSIPLLPNHIHANVNTADAETHVRPATGAVQGEQHKHGQIPQKVHPLQQQPQQQLNLTFATPLYKYRALFPNDEDMLGGFAPDPLGRNVFGAETWSRYCEAALRIKANTIQMGTVTYPDETASDIAARRGLVLTSSHFNLLGSNTYRWPTEMSSLPNNGWDWGKEPQAMAHMWKASIAAATGREVLWSVGLRGVTDASYTACGDDPRACAAAMNAVVSNMTSWIRASAGNENAPIIWFIFGETIALLSAGLLLPPSGVDFLAADNYPHIGTIPLDNAKLCSGVYYHAAWLSTFTNQLSEMVSPALFYDQIRKFSKASKATNVFVLNVSDLLPVLMAAELIMKYIWNPQLANAFATVQAAEEAALTQWAAREYTNGDHAGATKVTALLTRYYALLQVPASKPDSYGPTMFAPVDILNATITLGDVWLGNLSRSIAWCAINSPPAPFEQHAAQAPVCQAAEGMPAADLLSISARVADSPVRALLQTLAVDTVNVAAELEANASSGAAYFRASVELRHTMYASLWVASAATARALTAAYTAAAGNCTSALAAVQGNLTAALNAFDVIFAAQRAAEAGSRWRGVYAADTVTDLHRSRRVLVQLKAVLQNALTEQQSDGGGSGSGSGVRVYVPPETGASFYQWYDYQMEHQASFPLLHDSREWNLYKLVRVQCADSTTALSAATNASVQCTTLHTGGVFSGVSALVAMTAINADCPIRYTVDGTGPTENGIEYLEPVKITDNTTFKAALVCDGADPSSLFISTLSFIRR